MGGWVYGDLVRAASNFHGRQSVFDVLAHHLGVALGRIADATAAARVFDDDIAILDLDHPVRLDADQFTVAADVGATLRRRLATTDAEAHAYLLEYVSLRPLRDLAIQWKSAGAQVGSFNLLAYGSLMFVGSALQGSESYAHSRTAFAFFTVGLLNTFCNYGHHTYHLPQSVWIHWVSFIVSMLELLILAKVFLDLGKLLKERTGSTSHPVIEGFMRSATLWTFLMLSLSIVIAVPPLNVMLHGTHAISAHVMGSMVGIDSMILWAAMGYLVSQVVGADHVSLQKPSIRKAVRLTNVFLFAFILVYLLRGASAGWSRYAGAAASDYSEWVALFPTLMMVFGAGLMVSVLWVLLHWICALLASRNPA